MRVTIDETILELILCNITDLDTDAIVNAGNTTLQLGVEWRAPSGEKADQEFRKNATR